MKKLLIGAAFAVSMLATAPVASAAQYINVPAPAADGTITGSFGNDSIGLGDFADTFNFSYPANGWGGATISSVIAQLASTDVNFTSVMLNGVEFDIGLTGNVEFRSLFNQPISAGAQQLIVKGWSGGNGSYSGTLSFSPAGVPEPATWAMMIIGFTGAGVGIRVNRRQKALAAA